MSELIPYEDEPVISFPIMELRAPGNRVAPWDRIGQSSAGHGFDGVRNLLSAQAAGQMQQFNQAQQQQLPNNLLGAIGSGIFGRLR